MSLNAPFFSIVLPTYNRAHTLHRAIEGVLNQTEASWELVVVDDASTDETEVVVADYDDDRIKYIRHDDNRHVAAARNTGIMHAQGRYICFLDSDDEYLPRHLSVLHNAIVCQNEPHALFYTLSFRENGETRFKQSPPTCTDETPILIGDNPDTPAICIRAEILKKYKFNEDLKIHEDAELWGRIARKHPVHPILEHTVVVHLEGDDRVSRYSLRDLREHLKTYKLIWKDRANRVHVPRDAWSSKMYFTYSDMSSHYFYKGKITTAIYYMVRGVGVRPSIMLESHFWQTIFSVLKKIMQRNIRKLGT